MQINATPLRFPPMLWHALVDVRLVYNLGDVLGHVVDQRRIRGRDLGTVDCICGAGFDEEGEQGKYLVDEVDDDGADSDEEYCKAAAHGGQLDESSKRVEAVVVMENTGRR